MATGGVRSLTEIEETGQATVLRLRLAETELPRRPQAQPLRESWMNQINNILAFSRDDDWEEVQPSRPDPAVTARNEKRLKEKFDKMKSQLEKQEKRATEELRTLTEEQQEDVITFWTAAGEFFSSIMDWVKEMFQTVVEKLRQGFRVIKEAVKKIFETAKSFFKMLFKQ